MLIPLVTHLIFRQVDHGGPADAVRHVGDLGNVVTHPGKVVTEVDLTDDVISLINGEANSVVGRSVVIKAGEDDLGDGGDAGSLVDGNAGAAVACGFIDRV